MTRLPGLAQDFDAPGMKRKQHWNSFTTPFFLPLTDARRALHEKGAVAVDAPAAEALRHLPLRCHWCSAPQRTMPALKAHIVQCAGMPR